MARLSAPLITAFLAFPISLFAENPATGPRPVVVQGAMRLETEKLANRLDNVKVERVGGWSFWRGTLDGYPVIVSKTLKGVANAAAATVIAVERYRPVAIVNQGTAGGHDPKLRLYDIVLGASSVSLGAFKSPYRPAGAGSNTLDWKPLDLMVSEGSAGNDPKEHKVASFQADGPLLTAARSVSGADSGLNVPFLGISVVSDNITNGEAYDPKTGEACEDFVYQVVKAYIGTLKR